MTGSSGKERPELLSGIPGGSAADIVERITDGFFALDTDGRFVFLNRRAEEILGHQRADLLGRSVWKVFPEAMQTRVFRKYQHALANQQTVRFEHVVPWLDRRFDVRVYPSTTGVSVYFQDVTRNHRLEQERERLLAEEQAAREEAEREARRREEVVGIVSHDLRNPLNAIALNTELLLEVPLSEEESTERLRRIQSTVQRMVRLVEGLLDTQRFGAGQDLAIDVQRVDTRELLREACGLFEAQVASRRIQLVWEAPADVPAIRADAGRVLQVLWNLIGNAVRFTPEGESVRVRAEGQGAWVRFTVSDRGPGIREGDLPRLFDPFWQDKRTARLGAGLGLPISRALVEAHGGILSVQSRVGEGTTFAFTIPRAG